MRQKSGPQTSAAEKTIKDIRRATRKHHSAEDKIRIVLEGDIATPKSYKGAKEHDPDMADLISRLRTLTPQQNRVLNMLREGLLNKQIAYELGVSEATIKAHVSAILLKLKVDSRTQAVIQLSRINMPMVA